MVVAGTFARARLSRAMAVSGCLASGLNLDSVPTRPVVHVTVTEPVNFPSSHGRELSYEPVTRAPRYYNITF